ncbi:hypothetical protein [Chryseobacterium sp. Hurlbut01]|uniref:hypothetical protein n=1 Tax=Chryseobacterium sp. Hurlbut01 TaxID=1681828 RepID=UPI00067CBDD5|nr:hypothetical protein [Chryseobacterium sp. Hurlbut01]
MNLLSIFCNYHPEFMEGLNSFSELNRGKLLRKLKSAENRTAFLSTVSEIRFGDFFQKLDFEIKYDEKIEDKTPDWTLNSSTFPIICEVYRLGRSNKDQKRSDFENSLKKQLEKIPSNLVIKITIDDNYDNYDELQIDRIKAQFEAWLEKEPTINNELFLDYDFIFKVIAVSKTMNYLSCVNSGNIDYKIGKLKQFKNQRPNEITKKIQKYNRIITTQKLPFFICVDLDFASGFTHDEFEEYFLGSSVEFIDFDPKNTFTTDIGTLGVEWTKLGEFYQNLQISGIITCSNNNFKVLLNPIHKQIIYEEKYNDCLTKFNNYR